MTGILWGKFRLLIRRPGGIIATTIICMAFAFLTGLSSGTKLEIPVFSSLPEEKLQDLMTDLNKNDSYEFTLQTENEIKNRVAEGKVEAGIKLEEETYTLYRSGNTKNYQLIHQYIERFYQKMVRDKAVLALAGNSDETEKQLNSSSEHPSFDLSVSSYKDENDFVYDSRLQALFGFVLFFSIYTVAYNVVEILKEKQNGLWDRLILSPTSKTEMYLANLLYSFFIGYFQIAIIFLIFKFAVGINFYGSFWLTLLLIIPYVFAIVALSILLTGLVKTPGQFNALLPVISVSFAMLGGAYWPIEIVTSDPLIAISKVIPVTYGMEVLKGITISGQSLHELLYPISILILMGVVMMGIGIRLMERRHV